MVPKFQKATCYVNAGMSSSQLWGPEEEMPDLISDDSEEEHEAVVARAPRPPRPDAEALLTLGVSNDASACRRLPILPATVVSR